MAKVKQNEKIWAGDDVEMTFTVDDMDDLTGSTIKWKLGDALIEKSTEDGITVDGDQFTVILDSTDTQLDPGTYIHEAEILDVDGRYSTVAQGYITIKPTIISN